MSSINKFKSLFGRVAAILSAIAVSQIALMPFASAATLTGGFVSLSDSRPSTASVSYSFDADNITLSNIRCIRFDFGTAVDGTGDAGLTVASAAYDAAASDYIPDGQTWSVSATSEANDTIDITNATGETPGSASNGTVELDTITNGSTADNDYFLKVNTYNNTDCTSSPVDDAVVTFIYTTGQAVSLTVDPSLSFTIAGSASTCNSSPATTVTATSTTVPFGTVTTSTDGIATQNLTVSTNGGNGYTTFTRYTAAPTSGGNSIDDTTGTNASPAAFSAGEAFGYTTNDSTLTATGDGANRFTNSAPEYARFTTTNAEVAYSTAAVASEVTCVGYAVGISGTTPAGTYTNTVIFTTTPIY